MRSPLLLSSCLLAATSLASAKVLELTALEELHKELRGGDDRLIRPSPTKETAEAQTELCPFMISSLVETVKSSTDIKVRGEAAEVLALCTTENPANRADVGLANNGEVFEAISDLFKSGRTIWDSTKGADGKMRLSDKVGERKRGKVTKAFAQAAEAIWILSYNNENNQKGFFNAGIVDVLMGTIKFCPVSFSRDGVCSEAVMWMLAALQNLAASYCDSDNGSCEWEVTERRALVLPKGVKTVTKVDQQIRAKMLEFLKDENYQKMLNHLVCGGPVNSPHDETYSWPSKAKDIHSEHHPEIVPWAAAGLIKNLAIDKDIRKKLGEQTIENGYLFKCLCEIYRDTPDPYEEDKAFTALYRLSWDSHCPNIQDTCTDTKGWAEAETGKSCLDIQNEKLCATMGENRGKGTSLKANEACCACGGGIPKSKDEVENAKMKNKIADDFSKILEL